VCEREREGGDGIYCNTLLTLSTCAPWRVFTVVIVSVTVLAATYMYIAGVYISNETLYHIPSSCIVT
jgi:hypothetical protein